MLLNLLSFEEKQAFLQLAHYTAHSDNILDKRELVVIAGYCMEMQTDDINYDSEKFNLDEVLGVFIDPSHQKIALLELMTLIFSDDHYSDEEQKIVTSIIAKFGINPNLAIVYQQWAKGIISLHVQGSALIYL